MPRDIHIRPTDKAIEAFYRRRGEIARQGATNEMGVRDAFNDLLQTLAREPKWTMVPEQSITGVKGVIRPDGTLYDEFRIPRGYWESKDSADDLEAEIARKIARGYPQGNIIFENGAQAVLYQNRRRTGQYDLGKPADIALLFTQFLNHEDPAIEDFEQAVSHFKDATPKLATGLRERIREAHRDNKAFQAAFALFHELCRGALDPGLAADAVDDMLVQHLLTERLMRTVFGNTEFRSNNVIAAEVEKVIRALTAGHFNRDDYLGKLTGFYSAIEAAAATISDFHQKQGFISTVYERFFQGYSTKVADTHGIVYTPQPIVAWMVAAVDAALQREFGYGLDAPGVVTVDPCTGTGSFVVHLLQHIAQRNPGALKEVYHNRLFANEVLLMPYYVASLNIEHTYYELTGRYEPFDGMVLADTLELAERAGGQMTMLSEENAWRVDAERRAPVTVIIGNPPYNVGQASENDNNKNRKYNIIDKAVKDSYARDSAATLKAQLYDPYVKFFRWATDRLGVRDGIVCYVSNNSFVDQLAFDGMRKHLMQDFDRIYHLDLHGNVRQNPKLSGTTHNVFGIQVGVGITIAIRSRERGERRLLYYRVPEDWRKEEKLALLTESAHAPLDAIPWQALTPDAKHTWRVPENAGEYASFMPIGSKDAKQKRNGAEETIFATYSGGVKTNRDNVVYNFDRNQLVDRVKTFVEAYNSEIDRYKRHRFPSNIDHFVNYGTILWSRDLKLKMCRQKYADLDLDLVRLSIYRPFSTKYLYFERILVDVPGRFFTIFPDITSQSENRVIAVSGIGSNREFYCLATAVVPCYDAIEKSQCFPFYVYDEDGGNRRENITDAALARFRAHYGDATISKWDIFHYVYALLHHPGYRQRYAGNLKRELPRIPLVPASGVGPFTSTSPLGPLSVHGEGMQSASFPPSPRAERGSGGEVGFERGPGGEVADVEVALWVTKPELWRKLKPLARQMRHKPTPAEAALWNVVRRHGIQGLKFRRQHPIERFIVDFYCPALRLVVEVDGEIHQYTAEEDALRTEMLEALGMRVLRFTNEDVLHHPDDVLATLTAAATFPSPRAERGPGGEVGFERGPGGEVGLERGSGGEVASDVFHAFARAGQALADLHVNYETAEPYPLGMQWQGTTASWRVEKMRLSPDRTALVVNRALTLTGIPPQTFDYRLGSRSALEWVIDQYQVKTDNASGITSDPNRYSDDEQYIVNLVRRVVAVSVQTAGIVSGLAALPFGAEEASG
jgi:predicted helicase/very-short-patch-repair endonuclease